MWHSTIFGPYFVAGAIFSGIAALILAMAVLRKTLRLEKYLLPLHFDNLGKLLLLMSILWGYFVFNERLTVWYGNEPTRWRCSGPRSVAHYAPLYWTMVICNFVIPLVILTNPYTRTIPAASIASFGVVIGMWLERFLIVVPSLSHKQLPYSWGTYAADAGGAHDHGGDLCRHDPALHAVREVRADHRDLGAEGRPAVASRSGGGDRGAAAVDAARQRAVPARVRAQGSASMKAVYGLYDDPHVAQQAVDNLRAAGVADADITVISSEPFDHFEFGHRDAKTAMPWVAVAAGATGLVLTLLPARRRRSGRGRSSPRACRSCRMWSNLIIIFEMTMLSAILATVIYLFVSAGLPSRGGKMYDPEVSDGYILVGVENPADAARLEPALAIGGGRVKTDRR